MTFASLPIEVNPANLIDEVVEEMQAQFPDWEAFEGNVETWLIRGLVTRLVVPLAELASEMGEEAFARFGALILATPPHAAVPATVKASFETIDADGYTIPEGTQVDVAVSGSDLVGFRTIAPVEVEAGKTEVEEVLLEAIEPGAAGTGLTGEATLVDALSFIIDVDLEEATSGGADAETPAEYLDRLAEVTKTLAPRPVIARDVAILARTIAGVARVGVLDNYNATTEEGEQEKTTSVYPIDDEGAPVSEAIREEIQALLEARREANFIFIVAEPDYNSIDVNATIVPRLGFDKEQTAEEVKSAIEDFLSPASWGASPEGDASTWIVSTKLRFQDLVTVVNNVEGVDHYTTLEWRKAAESFASADITMTGAAPLPEPDAISVT